MVGVRINYVFHSHINLVEYCQHLILCTTFYACVSIIFKTLEKSLTDKKEIQVPNANIFSRRFQQVMWLDFVG